MNLLKLIGRSSMLFDEDIISNDYEIKSAIFNSKVLVIGGAGSIGQAVSREIFKRNPKALHIVDLSENNLVELVRDIRSTLGYIEGDFKTFAIDCDSKEFDALIAAEGPYDYIFNLSALKHVRSEKDPYTLMRMLKTNIFNILKTVKIAKLNKSKQFFCVSTDKAANPVNMMGGSKNIMEMFLMRESLEQKISMARFANVAFSDGSLMHGFNQRFIKRQPISAPKDVTRFFVTPQESGELCLMSGLLGNNRDIFFPKEGENLRLISFSDIAMRYLEQLEYEPYECSSEQEAREKAKDLISLKKWPCYFFESDTTGEKNFEEFYTDNEILDLDQFLNIGIIKNEPLFNDEILDNFYNGVQGLLIKGSWNKSDILKLFNKVLPDFLHKETGRYLDQKM
jgi:FlaA1/EpsC-like NDP-sugar epimerase